MFVGFEDIGELDADSEDYSYASEDTMWKEISLSMFNRDQKSVSTYMQRPYMCIEHHHHIRLIT